MWFKEPTRSEHYCWLILFHAAHFGKDCGKGMIKIKDTRTCTFIVACVQLEWVVKQAYMCSEGDFSDKNELQFYWICMTSSKSLHLNNGFSTWNAVYNENVSSIFMHHLKMKPLANQKTNFLSLFESEVKHSNTSYCRLAMLPRDHIDLITFFIINFCI